MKIENLKVGQIIKNYKEMCVLLDEEITTGGNKKKAQHKEWERYFKYHKQGNKYIIDEIYKDPLPKVENIKNSKYSVYIEKLIIHMLSRCPINKDTKTINMSRNGLYLMLHMINENYTLGRNNINSFSRHLKIPTATLYDFYNDTTVKMNSAVERTLNKLQRQCLIKWEYRISVKLTSGAIRLATDDEISFIVECERKTLKEFKCKDKQEVFLKGKWNKFNHEVIQKIIKEYNILYYFKTFYIYTTEDFREMLLNEWDILTNQSELNNELYFSTLETAEKHHKKISNKYFGIPKYENEKVAILQEYPIHIKKIADVTISEGAEKIEINENCINKPYLFKDYIYEKGLNIESEEDEEVNMQINLLFEDFEI